MKISKEEIKRQLAGITAIMKNCKTVEDARNLSNSYGFLIEIGAYGNCGEYCFNSSFDETDPKDIEWFRVESFENLGYIYFFTDGVVYFDVYEDDGDDPCMEDVTPETLDERYALGY